MWSHRARAGLVAPPTEEGFFFARCRAPRAMDGAAFYFASALADQHAMFTDAYLVSPIFGQDRAGEHALFNSGGQAANVSESGRRYLAAIGYGSSTLDAVWLHSLAIGYSPSYLRENADGIARDWPRVPFPCSAAAFGKSTELGRRVSCLLDPLKSAKELTTVARLLGSLSSANGTQLAPEDLGMKAQWGVLGELGVHRFPFAWR